MSVHTEKYEAVCQPQAYQDLRADILQTLAVRAFENNWSNWFRNLRYNVSRYFRLFLYGSSSFLLLMLTIQC